MLFELEVLCQGILSYSYKFLEIPEGIRTELYNMPVEKVFMITAVDIMAILSYIYLLQNIMNLLLENINLHYGSN